MQRGSIAIVSAQGDYGKPRPAVVIQAGIMSDLVGSVTVCFVTSDLAEDGLMRVPVAPDPSNGLVVASQIQVEKVMTFPSGKVRGPIGLLDAEKIAALDKGLMFFLDLFHSTAFLSSPSRTDNRG